MTQRESVASSATEIIRSGLWEKWVRWGIVDRVVAAGVQFNINAAKMNIDSRVGKDLIEEGKTEGSACRLSCTLDFGGYNCGSGLKNNPGLDHNLLAPFEKIVAAFNNQAEGVRAYLGIFVDRFLGRSNLPAEIIAGLRENSLQGKLEANIFGGSPNEHPDLGKLISVLVADKSLVVNLTDTGVGMTDENFADMIANSGLNRLSLSMDFLTPEKIREYNQIPMSELKTIVDKTPSNHGQEKKALAAIYTLRLAKDKEKYPNFPGISINLAFSPDGVDRVIEVVDLLGEEYGVKVNAYPGQEGYEYKNPLFNTPELLAKAENVIDELIRRHREFDLDHIVPRFHYYLALKAIFNAYRDNPKVLAEKFNGSEVWQCYHQKDPNNPDGIAGRYTQFGVASHGMRFPKEESAGGFEACFWNGTIHDMSQRIKLWDYTLEQARERIPRYMITGMAQAARAFGPDACQGCLMPRLMFDLLTTLAGIKDPKIKTEFLNLCHREIGWPPTLN